MSFGEQLFALFMTFVVAFVLGIFFVIAFQTDPLRIRLIQYERGYKELIRYEEIGRKLSGMYEVENHSSVAAGSIVFQFCNKNNKEDCEYISIDKDPKVSVKRWPNINTDPELKDLLANKTN